jgi:hypothetical protein
MPNGRRITFGGTVDAKSGIYSAPADGSAKPELLLATDSLPTQFVVAGWKNAALLAGARRKAGPNLGAAGLRGRRGQAGSAPRYRGE